MRLTGLDWDAILTAVRDQQGLPARARLRAAFYADCRHEVKPVSTGYRVTFTCNLLMDSDPAGEVPAELSAEAARYLTDHFTIRVSRWTGDDREPPNRLVYLPDHAYTQRGLSRDRLKGANAERPRSCGPPLRMRVRGGTRAHRDQGGLGHRAGAARPRRQSHVHHRLRADRSFRASCHVGALKIELATGGIAFVIDGPSTTSSSRYPARTEIISVAMSSGRALPGAAEPPAEVRASTMERRRSKKVARRVCARVSLRRTVVPTGAYYQTESSLTKAEIEIVTNLINGRWLAAYSNYEHEKIGEQAGHLPPDKVQALIAGLPTAFDDDRQQIVYELASTLIQPRYVPLGLFRRAREALGDAGIVDVTMLLGWFTGVSLTLAAFDVPASAAGLNQ